MASDNIHKTANITFFGLYEITRTHLDVRNVAWTFQRFIDDLFGGLDFVQGCVDECLIASPGGESHLQNPDVVFGSLQRHGTTLGIQKCQAGTDPLDFLGHTIGVKGILPLEIKVNYCEPSTDKQVRMFNGLVNFCQRIIANWASLMRQLTGQHRRSAKLNSLKKNVNKAFSKFKESFAKRTILAH